MKLFGNNIMLNTNNRYILDYISDKFADVIFDKNLNEKIVIIEETICDHRYLNLYDAENIYINEEIFIFEKVQYSYLYFHKKENWCTFYISPIYTHFTERIFANRLFYIISYWLSTNGILSLHGGAFFYTEFPDKSVLIFGESGGGKTSIILNAINDGGKMSSEENLFIETQRSPMRILTNKQDISICLNDLLKKHTHLSNFITKNKLANKGKVRVGLRNMNSNVYVQEMIPSVIVILNAKKRIEASFKAMDKLSAVKRLIRLHKIYESYGMLTIVKQICDLVAEYPTYELTPSVDTEKTKKAILCILKERK